MTFRRALRLALFAVGAALFLLMAADGLARISALKTRLASAETLADYLEAGPQYSRIPLDASGMPLTGASGPPSVSPAELIDPLSGKPYVFVAHGGVPSHVEPNRPVAYAPLTESPKCWIFPLGSGDRSGVIFFTDAHASWYQEFAHREILSEHGLPP